MSELEKGILRAILESQLKIEQTVYDSLSDYGYGVVNDTLKKLTYSRILAISRQLEELK